MSSARVKLYTDEDVNAALALQLQKLGYDAVSTRDAGNAHKNRDDEWQLSYATKHGRTLLVHNFNDYMVRDKVWRSQGRQHCGIVMVDHISIGELVRRTKLLLDTFTPVSLHNMVLYLPT